MSGAGVDWQFPGVTETILTRELQESLRQSSAAIEPCLDKIDDAEVPERYARHVANIVRAHLSSLPREQRALIIEQLLTAIGQVSKTPVDQTEITALMPRSEIIDKHYFHTRPETPLNDAALLTNASHDPTLNSELRAELASADNVDLLCAFLKWTGLRLLEDELAALRARGGRLRVITTTYIGATERRAIDRLVREFGAEVRVQYDTKRTRLHAKSWYFHRNTGWDTAYVGSSNLSRAALLDGVEWNVRLSKEQTGPLLAKFRRTFETYWNDPSYEIYNPTRDANRLDKQLDLASGGSARFSDVIPVNLDVRPYPHQQEALEALRIEREMHEHHRNLVIAATGTGKTVISAFDYRSLCSDGRLPTMLFVAHRIEILKQARSTFRAVLKDGSFGELLGNGHEPLRWRHVFATVQSLSPRLDMIRQDLFDYVVIDEFHHAHATSYRKLLSRLKPKELLGLTATPERADGVDIRSFFDGRSAYEIRLWDALEADLLCPFHYFAISDNTDLRGLSWNRGRYDPEALSELYVQDEARSALILTQLHRLVIDPRGMRAIGFCVSVRHARYMSRVFNQAGVPALAVTGQSSDEERAHALDQLRGRTTNIIFTVDLYNEGIDLPEIDTVLFLRPTESSTLFLQQLGRGLRKSRDKAVLTVLDFVGMQHAEFRFDKKLCALTGSTKSELRQRISEGFHVLPAGTEISIDQMSQEIILDNLKSQLNPRWNQKVIDLRQLVSSRGDCDLGTFLQESEHELSSVISTSSTARNSWTKLREDAGLPVRRKGPRHDTIIRRARALSHVDDQERLDVYRQALAGELPPLSTLNRRELTLLRMLVFTIWPDGGKFANLGQALAALTDEPAACDEFSQVLDVAARRIRHITRPLSGRLHDEALRVHARYTREEIVVGMRHGGFDRHPNSIREGVFFSKKLNADALLITLRKNEKGYSPTTMYNDVAISESIFHWESQSTTSVESPTARRYLGLDGSGSERVLFVREDKKSEYGAGAPYLCLGTADYISHEGSRPIGIDWRLRVPMPAEVWKMAAAARP
ncbi:MAG: DUF3427 domain-containing protein [Propionibacteriaceae bacterium]|nr:DUF3427 domain-containing protein [Propionibacteriaceae bacterium]